MIVAKILRKFHAYYFLIYDSQTLHTSEYKWRTHFAFKAGEVNKNLKQNLELSPPSLYELGRKN
jgi:hypothetical protein